MLRAAISSAQLPQRPSPSSLGSGVAWHDRCAQCSQACLWPAICDDHTSTEHTHSTPEPHPPPRLLGWPLEATLGRTGKLRESLQLGPEPGIRRTSPPAMARTRERPRAALPPLCPDLPQIPSNGGRLAPRPPGISTLLCVRGLRLAAQGHVTKQNRHS